MDQNTNLYSILVSYANKNNSPYIKINAFLEVLGKYAKKQSAEQSEWLKWLENRNAKFWAELSDLAEEGKCELLTDTAGDDRIYMPYFCSGLIRSAYSNGEKDADLPFPSEELLKISLPEDQLKSLGSVDDIIVYLEEPQDTDIPILKIIFPYGFGSALALANLFTKRLMDMAVLKIGNYLNRYGNKEYAFRKLCPQLQGKENFIKDQLNQILTRPTDTSKAIAEARDFTCLFWTHFCGLVKNDIKNKNEYLSGDIAALQSVFLIEAFSGYYKSLANKRRNEELAFRALEKQLANPPFLYTVEQVLGFKYANGMPLLKHYSKEALDLWIKNKTTESKNHQLPVLLVIKGSDNERRLCCKDKMLPLCLQLLSDGRRLVTGAVSKRWQNLFLDYKRERAMESDGEYEKLLAKLAGKLCPTLSALLEDPKLLLIYDEMKHNPNMSPGSLNIFNNGQLVPYSSLFLTQRKVMLANIKLNLPFWYSMPVLMSIIAFFKKLTNKKKEIRVADERDEAAAPEEKSRAEEIRAAAEKLESDMVPERYTLDTYLEQLESRWSKLIDKKARENLVTDVKSLIRDYLRLNLKVQKRHKLTRDMINQMAVNAIVRSPSLSAMSDRNSLILYSELYLLKLLQKVK